MIYFDNAATTMEKPASVVKAVTQTMTSVASPGRGDSSASSSAAEIMFSCREAAAELFHVPQPEQVVFTFNATHGLNIAIKTLVKSGDTVLISGYEHNAVTRPLASIPGIEVRVADTPLFEPGRFLERMTAEIKKGVQVVICTHVSNVFGYVLPVEEVARLCADRGIPLIVDASQSAGVLPVSMERLSAAFIAMPGHKSLYAPQGTGLLLCRDKGQTQPLLHGGTGNFSARQTMPGDLPERLEAGTQNVAGVAGLLEGLRFVSKKGERTILAHERALMRHVVEGMKTIHGAQVFVTEDPAWQTGVLSFRLENNSCESVGEYLSSKQVAVRTGLHCAPLAHNAAGTEKTGTVRLSFSAFNTVEQVNRFLYILRRFQEKRS